MTTNYEFACGAASGEAAKEQVVRDAERMVKWAAEPVIPGELVKAQIRNASERLQLDFGTVRRAWYRLSGPEIYPIIFNAWAELVRKRTLQIVHSSGAAPAPSMPTRPPAFVPPTVARDRRRRSRRA